MKKKTFPILFAILCLAIISVTAQKKKNNTAPSEIADSLKNLPMTGLKFRGIGPAMMGGRIVDITVNPENHSEYYVASGHGSLWKTSNNGVTFTPIFDKQKSHSMGVITIDPSNPHILWVGTGENDNQYNVIYGDGVYKSEDGGKNWKNMGLVDSEHIGGIVVDPRNSSVALVAAYGSLRNPGGDRGIFKTTDGGSTWERVLFVSENTGFYEIHMDPRDPDLLYAVAHQRMRKLYTNISGGPETAIYRSIDGGDSWHKLSSGLPAGDMGRIGMAISPANPDVVYAIIEADKDEKGLYRSNDRGASWTKQSSYVSSYPFYFQKLFCDTEDENRLYSGDVFMQVSDDGGKTWENLGEKYKHVDNHAMWVDPSDNRHLLVGCDGGLYESYDQGENWDFKSTLPIAEIYKISADNDTPFYNVYGGTQDNNSFGGPSRTINDAGIINTDWFITWGGDGFETQIDWQDPNILYAQAQYGALVRYDKKSGEKLNIQPQDFADSAFRWDWDSPLLISTHDHQRLYFGANKLFRTDDQGNSWEIISPDLTRGVPQKMDKIMGRSWSVDELAYKGTMAQITTIAESPIDEDILYVGSGDGLIHVTRDGGKKWVKSSLPGLPEYARVHHIIASQHNKVIAYAACHALTGGNYQPFLYKTTDGGDTWRSLNGNLPEKGSTYCMGEDHKIDKLLFVGTQYGLYYTLDGGQEWISLREGMPSVTVTDLDIQQRESDMVVSTFGRGIYILDDYSPLRYLTKETLEKEAEIFPIKDGLMFINASPLGYRDVGSQGSSFFAAPNPNNGVAFTYYLKDDFKTLKEKRRKKEKEIQQAGGEIKYPPYNELREEMDEPESYLLFTITDEEGHVVRKLNAKPEKGIQRIYWDFRYSKFHPIALEPFDDTYPWIEEDLGYMVVPGKYLISLHKYSRAGFTELVPPQEFTCKPLNDSAIPANEREALNDFNKRVAELTRAITGADAFRSELAGKLDYLKKAVLESADAPAETYEKVVDIELQLGALNRQLNGDALKSRYEGAAPTAIKARVELITSSLWTTTAAPTQTFVQSYEAAADLFDGILESLKTLDKEIKEVESILEEHGAPHTPGRLPEWKKNED